MSTRSTILVTDQSTTFRLYKHCDGYQTDNLRIISAALARAVMLQSEASERFKAKSESIRAMTMVGLIIGEATTVYGMGATVEEHYNEPFNTEMIGNQWDIEWVYIIDTHEQTVKVYAGNFEHGPQYSYAQGTVDPLSYAKQLRGDYRDEETKEIAKYIQDIEAWSFKVNPLPPQPKNVVQLKPKAATAPKKRRSKLQPWQIGANK